MTNNLENNLWEHNLSPCENMLNSLVNKQARNNERNASTSYEESRHFDGVLEVEVKDSTKNHNVNKLCLARGITIKKLQSECNKLKDELNKTVVEQESSRRVFRAVTGELKKQLDMAKQRESESQTKTLGLRLENEKLQVLLESKNGLVDKLRKELMSSKRAFKVAIKDICNVSRVSDVTFSDAGYEDFENSLMSPKHARSPRSPISPRSPRVRFADSLQNDMDNSLTNRHDTQTL